MAELNENHIVLVDSATATALAQVLPVLLLTLTVELRRTKLHRSVARVRVKGKNLRPGDLVRVKVTAADGYDLAARALKRL